jgi:hypothetical protein
MRPGFENQWSFAGTCARHALRHALLCLSIAPTEREVTRATGKSRLSSGMFGTDEQCIKRAIVHFGCSLIEIHRASPIKMREKVDDCLRQGLPLIVCADKWEHWALLCGRAKKDYCWIDSDRRRLVGASPWNALRPWLECAGEVKPYYALALRPEPAVLRHSLVPRMHVVMSSLESRELRRRWGEYVHVLKRFFRAGGDTHIPASEFFAARRVDILAAAPKTERTRGMLSRRLEWLRQVAELHNMGVPRDGVLEASSYLARQLPVLP